MEKSNEIAKADAKSAGSVPPLLARIISPADLRTLDTDQLPQVCDEIREFIISHLSSNPGHFASSMGAVEIIVALHYVFSTPRDRIVWDVGHQAYAHKILTGRQEAFDKQRTLGGISGFPTPSESEYDTFVTGHAGNSISAALGMNIADRMTPGEEDRKTVAVIGDASIGNGLAFEGLNNTSNNPNNLLIILNDNDMSIDGNVGALHQYLSEIYTSAGYNRWRYRLASWLQRKGYLSDKRKGSLLRLNNSVKSFISGGQNIFEGLNIRYFGPFDGHDVKKIVHVLNDIKDMEGPRILHLCTVKGKGYEKAEKDPTTWHAPGKFDPDTGERMKKPSAGQPLNWQEVFGRTLVELADADPRVTGITAAMATGTSMTHMLAKYPRRAFDVGISEGHAVTFAGGLASAGKRPFVAIYSSFLQRAYDNIVNDIAIQGLPVTFCIDRAGVVGEDGVTHHGLLDISYLSCIPGMKIAAPADEETLRNLMHTSLSLDGPIAIRYPRGSAVNAEWQTPMRDIEVGKGRLMTSRHGARTVLLTVGPNVDAAKAAEILMGDGVPVDHYDMIWVKPLDTGILDKVAADYDNVITVEDGTVNGGFGTAVGEYLRGMGFKGKVGILGVPDRWTTHGKVAELKALCGYDTAGIVREALKLSEKNK